MTIAHTAKLARQPHSARPAHTCQAPPLAAAESLRSISNCACCPNSKAAKCPTPVRHTSKSFFAPTGSAGNAYAVAGQGTCRTIQHQALAAHTTVAWAPHCRIHPILCKLWKAQDSSQLQITLHTWEKHMLERGIKKGRHTAGRANGKDARDGTA
jgi:hypothetical protein